MRAASPRGRLRLGAVAVMAAVAMASSLLLSSPVHATHEEPVARGVDGACPPRQVPDPGFGDTTDNPHQAAIACVAAWNIAEGRTDTVYDPAALTRRDQMASFIVRMLDTAGADVPQDAPRAFDDVPPGNIHYGSVNALAQMGVVVGQTANTYQPARPVRRDQMASFISRAVDEHLLGETLVDDHQWFADVDEANVHFATVNGLAAHGIVEGRDAQARRYGPSLHVRRDAMAAFVGRTLDLLAAEGAITPPPTALRAARATVVDTNGAELGRVVVGEAGEGRAEVYAFFRGLPPGSFHGFHIHGTRCSCRRLRGARPRCPRRSAAPPR